MNRITKDWLFGDHSQNEIYTWISTLKYFLFFRAIGGHANDGDYLELRIGFNKPNDQDTFLKGLNITSGPFLEATKIKLPSPFEKFNCNISRYGTVISVVGISGNPYKMGDLEYQLCLSLEKLIKLSGLEVMVSYDEKKRPTCVTWDGYSDYF